LKDKNQLVSCVITTCKREKLLARAIESVLGQTYQNIELIVIDDSPCGETKNVVSQYLLDNSRMQYIENEKKLGPMGARNKAVEHAKGDLIAFLDDDDYWVKEKLSKQVDHCEEHSFVSCLALIDNSKKIREQQKSFEAQTISLEEAFISTSNVFPSGLLLKKENFISVGGFDTKLVEHDFFYSLLLKHGSGYIVHEGLVVFNRDPQLERVSNDIEPYLGLLTVILKYRNLIKKNIFNKKIAGVYFTLSTKSEGILLKLGFLLMSFSYNKQVFLDKFLRHFKYKISRRR